MTTSGDENAQHWNSLGGEYAVNWAGAAREALSNQETAFVRDHVPLLQDQRALDVGVGTGRILEQLLAHERMASVYGVDVSPSMLEVCRGRFGDHPKLAGLAQVDLEHDTLPVRPGLGFISAVRVLKYSPNWWNIVTAKLVPLLRPRGVLVFSMPNRRSVKAIARPYDVDYFLTTVPELRQRLAAEGLDVLSVTGFAKLPEPLYAAAHGRTPARTLRAVERILDGSIGGASLSRELFIAARRP